MTDIDIGAQMGAGEHRTFGGIRERYDFGKSGGGGKVSTLMQCLGQWLFPQSVVQSATGLRGDQAEITARVAAETLYQLGLNGLASRRIAGCHIRSWLAGEAAFAKSMPPRGGGNSHTSSKGERPGFAHRVSTARLFSIIVRPSAPRFCERPLMIGTALTEMMTGDE